jgi:hypothetical protein
MILRFAAPDRLAAPATGEFTVNLLPSPELAERLRDIERVSIDLGDQVLIEDHDLVITVGKSLRTREEETGITVQVEIGASRTGCTALLLVDKEKPLF